MSKKFDWTISSIRMISMLLIITCHFMQYFNNELAWWFNVGVQIFLCISGYLYGCKREKIEYLKFYTKNFKKILISYYIVFIPFSLILLFMNIINLKTVILGICLKGTVPGGGHLWFIPTILLCYIITPFLSEYVSSVGNQRQLLVKYVVSIFVCFIIISLYLPSFSSAWISCYISGYFLSRITNMNTYKRISITVILIALILNTIQIFSDYIMHLNIPFYTIFCNYAHAFLGVSIFILLKYLLRNMKSNYILRLSDKYSYEIYLGHQFYILGPLSLMQITSNVILNTIIVLIAIIVTAWLIKKASYSITRKNICQIIRAK